jgi:hypothetical protein
MWAIGVGVDRIPKEDIAEFLATVGELIVSWSAVESKLGHLYCITTGAHGLMVTPFHAPIEAAYYAVNSFEGRLAMNNSAVIRMPGTSEALQKDWTTLADRISQKYRLRSLAAHSGMFGQWEKKRSRQIWLSPNPAVSSVVRREGIQRFFKDDLIRFVGDFRTMCDDIDKFSNRCFRAMMPPTPVPPKPGPRHPSHT